jgi:hypothetical protein
MQRGESTGTVTRPIKAQLAHFLESTTGNKVRTQDRGDARLYVPNEGGCIPTTCHKTRRRHFEEHKEPLQEKIEKNEHGYANRKAEISKERTRRTHERTPVLGKDKSRWMQVSGLSERKRKAKKAIQSVYRGGDSARIEGKETTV